MSAPSLSGETEAERRNTYVDDFAAAVRGLGAVFLKLVRSHVSPSQSSDFELYRSGFLSRFAAEIDSRVPFCRARAAIAGSANQLINSAADQDLPQESRVLIRSILKRKRLSHRKWAVRAGVNRAVVDGYMNGTSKPRPHNRQALAEVLDLPDLPG